MREMVNSTCIYSQSKDEEYLEMLIAEEHEGSKIRIQKTKEEEMNEKKKKKKNKEALIDELVCIT